MKIFIIGLGHGGQHLAKALRERGHTVYGSTTTQDKVEKLESVVDKVFVLRGDEQEKLHRAAKDCDAIIVAAAPKVVDTTSPEAREKIYEDVLVKSCQSALSVCDRIIFMSSFSVYGDGGEGIEPITEESPLTEDQEPSAKYFQAAERVAMQSDQATVLRFPDMYGAPGDMTYPERVQFAHRIFNGKTPFGPDYPMYVIHYDDVVKAIVHVLEKNLHGVFNVTDNDILPATNKQVFDAICEREGFEKLTFLDQIKAPGRKISAEKIYATGYRITHEDPTKEYLQK